MSEIHDECGVAAVYHLPSDTESPLCPAGPEQASRLLPRMLLDMQNRGQLAAGITTYSTIRDNNQLIDTHKDIGTVAEVFRLSHSGKRESLMTQYAGRAGIGHVRYATCGKEDRSYAQPFERHHLQKAKWFSFAFNGQLANYKDLRNELMAGDDYHLTRETDTEIMMHEISREISLRENTNLIDVVRQVRKRFDGAYSLVLMNARGDLLVARDPLGIKPLCYAKEGPLFAAASESVALDNLGFQRESIKTLAPGEAILIHDGKFSVERYAESSRQAHCFFEWVYFANVASRLDGSAVYVARTKLGEALAEQERKDPCFEVDEDTIVVPVPDTSKAAADSMAFQMQVPCREGLIRNRYSGRTFIEGSQTRRQAVEAKYTPLREVLEGKRVILVEDSIVRSTTMTVLMDRIREIGGAKEIHVRVACPPIVAPCFYGIDMSTIGELFAPKFMPDDFELTAEAQVRMAEKLGADSLRYLPVSAISKAIGKRSDQLCQACITGEYPTECGQKLYQLAGGEKGNNASSDGHRTYEGASEAPVAN